MGRGEHLTPGGRWTRDGRWLWERQCLEPSCEHWFLPRRWDERYCSPACRELAAKWHATKRQSEHRAGLSEEERQARREGEAARLRSARAGRGPPELPTPTPPLNPPRSDLTPAAASPGPAAPSPTPVPAAPAASGSSAPPPPPGPAPPPALPAPPPALPAPAPTAPLPAARPPVAPPQPRPSPPAPPAPLPPPPPSPPCLPGLPVAPATPDVGHALRGEPFCDRPGCYRVPMRCPGAERHFCSAQCRLALKRVEDRENKWLLRGALKDDRCCKRHLERRKEERRKRRERAWLRQASRP